MIRSWYLENVPAGRRQDRFGDFADLGLGQSLLELGRQILQTEGPEQRRRWPRTPDRR